MMEWAGSTQVTAAKGRLKNIRAHRAPRARFQTGAFAECYCHLVLPSSPCAELPGIRVRAQPQGKALQLVPSVVVLGMSVELHRFSRTAGEHVRGILSPCREGRWVLEKTAG